VILERGPLSLKSTISSRNSSSFSLETENTDVGIRCADHVTLYPLMLELTSPTSGSHSVGIVHSRTKAKEISLV
jgi:hypothetical protein